MQRIKELCKRKTLSRRICTSTSALLISAAFLISFTLPFLYAYIRKSQIMLPQTFFDQYNKYSLQQVGKNAKDFILAGVDARNIWVNSIKRSMTNPDVQNLSLSNKYSNASFVYGNNSGQVNCMLPNAQNSIFKCEMDLYTTILLQESWKFNTRAKTKRFNIYYQNLNNPKDIMVKTISALHDFKTPNVETISRSMRLQKQGVLTFSNFYADQNGQSGDSLVAFRTKIYFTNYSVLLQLQSFGQLFTVTITRVLYSDSVNIIIVQRNSSNSKGYELVSNFKELNPYINYKNLLEPGFAKTPISQNSILYSYTSYFSSAYKVGTLTLQTDIPLNLDYIVIIHSLSMSTDMEKQIYNFIYSLRQCLITFTALGFSMLIIMVLTSSLITAQILGNTFSNAKKSLINYLNNAEVGAKTLNEIMIQSKKKQFVRIILREIYQIIKIIEFKKRKFRKTSMESNKYPLNIIQKQFQILYQRKDLQQINSMLQKIKFKANHEQKKE